MVFSKKAKLFTFLILLSVIMFSFNVKKATATTLSLWFDDPVGDQSYGNRGATKSTDLTAMNMIFDNVSGDYAIYFHADSSNPFFEHTRLNVNLLNPDTGINSYNPAFFQDTVNDYYLPMPVTQMALNGSNSRLMCWDVGDRVASSHHSFGNPPGTLISAFGSAVISEPPPYEYVLSASDRIEPQVATVLPIETISTQGQLPTTDDYIWEIIKLLDLAWDAYGTVDDFYSYLYSSAFLATVATSLPYAVSSSTSFVMPVVVPVGLVPEPQSFFVGSATGMLIRAEDTSYLFSFTTASPPPGTAPVPEPATIVLLGAGLIGLKSIKRRFTK